MSTHKSTEPTSPPHPARRALLTGGAAGLVAAAGATLGGAQPASAATVDVTWITPASPPNANTDTAAIQGALNGNGFAMLAPGTFLINQTLLVPVQSAGGSSFSGALIGAGPGATTLMYSGGGPAVSAHGTAALGTTMAQGNGARIMHLTIDGSNVPATLVSSGLDAGDQADLLVWDVTIQNFTSTGTTGATGSNPNGAVGLNINNTLTWTEKYKVWVMTNNCTNAVQLITTTGNSTSHMYSGDLEMHVNANPNQNGLVVARQGNLLNGRLIMRGNFLCPASGSNSAAAILLGTQNQQATIQRMHIDVYVESDPSGSGLTQPTTIKAGTPINNTVTACHGRLQFLDGWQESNLSPQVPGEFVFFGPIVGDQGLSGVSANPGNGLPALVSGAPYIYGLGSAGINGGAEDINPGNGDFFSVPLAGNVTVNLNADGGVGGPQRKTIVIQQSSAGGFTVTWPHNGSPSLASPTVLWPGGNAPTMTAAANAIDVYKLETIDGATWYGQALHNLS